jgi:thiamine biosynthesis lipoprotein
MTTLRVDFPAIGTTATVVVQRIADLVPARMALQCELDRIDAACSRFRPDSELAHVQRAGGRPVPIGEALYEAVAVALRAAEATNGLVDPTVGNALVELGYDRDFAAVLARAAEGGHDVSPPGPARGWRSVVLDAERRSLDVPPGVLLDLGATAKALIVDRAAAAAAQRCSAGVLLSVGGDMAVAGPQRAGGWSVRIADRHDVDAPAAAGAAALPSASGPCVALHDGALATSSTTVRRWQQAGRDRHHIIDPTTGSPVVETWRTVSVAGATCVDANTASTAAILLGPAAPGWLAGLGLPARLVSTDGTVRTVGGWPPDAERGPAGTPAAVAVAEAAA